MKWLILIPLIAVCSASMAQSVSTRIDAIMTKVLEDDGILLKQEEKDCKDCEWESCKGFLRSKEKRKKVCLDKDQRLRDKLLGTFRSTISYNPKDTCKSLFNYNISLAKLGSFLIYRNNSFITVQPQNVPEFSILANGNQLGYAKPEDNSDKFEINYTSNKFFTSDVSAGFEGEYLDYFRAKAEVANTNVTKSKKHLNLAVGTFENELANVFDRAKKGSSFPSDFVPLYELWTMYSNGTVKGSDAIIKSFSGLVYRATTGYDDQENFSVSSSASGGYNAQFIKASGSSSMQYKNSKDVSKSSLSYKIEMFRAPDLETVPPADKIVQVWQSLSRRECRYNETGVRYILPDQPLEINLTFGPVPDLDMAINNIELDERYTLDSMPVKFISSIKPILQNQRDIGIFDKEAKTITVKVRITRDESFVNNYTNNTELSDNLKIRLYYKHPVKFGTATTPTYLDYVFEDIPVATTIKPQLVLNNNELPEPAEDGNFYAYDFAGQFRLNEGQGIDLSKPMGIVLATVPDGVNAAIRESLKKGVKDYSKIKAHSSERFSGSIRFPKKLNLFSADLPELMNAEFQVSFSDGKKNYIKPIFLSLKAPKDKIQNQPLSSSASFKDVMALVSALDMEKVLEGYKYEQKDSTVALDQYRFIDLEKMDAQPHTFLEQVGNFNADFKVLTEGNRYIIETKYLKGTQQ